MARAGNRVTRGITRGIAASVAVAASGWVAFGLPAAADPGNGNAYGNANSNGNGAENSASAPGQQGQQGQGQQNGNGNGNGKDPKGPKGNNGNHHGQGQGQQQGQGSHGQGQEGKGNQGQGQGAGGGEQGDKGDPPGNNGTVKITPHLEDDGIPQNSPHVSCIFDIEWYGFDEGPDIVSTVEFAMQAPTDDVALSGTEPSEVFVGGDPASGAGTDSGFDGEATYMLAFDGEPHPKQGYHVKLTVHTPGSQGADTKHKVFWVQPCTSGEETLVSDTAVDQTAVQESVATGQSEEQQVSAGAAGVEGTSTAGGASAADVPTQVDAGAEGSLMSEVAGSAWALMAIALGMLLAGAAVLARRRTS